MGALPGSTSKVSIHESSQSAVKLDPRAMCPRLREGACYGRGPLRASGTPYLLPPRDRVVKRRDRCWAAAGLLQTSGSLLPDSRIPEPSWKVALTLMNFKTP